MLAKLFFFSLSLCLAEIVAIEQALRVCLHQKAGLARLYYTAIRQAAGGGGAPYAFEYSIFFST